MTSEANNQTAAASGQDNRTPRGPIKMLFVSSDRYPPFRVDVAVLFGEEMSARGHKIDWLLQSERDCTATHVAEWNGWQVYVGTTDNGDSLLNRVRKHIFGILHDFNIFRLVRPGRYDFIQVKDKFIAALFAIVAARLNRTRFVFWLSYPFPEASLYAADIGTARYPLLYRVRGTVFRLLLYKVIARYSHHIFVQSEQMKLDIMAQGVPEHLLTAVPMGVETALLETQLPCVSDPEPHAMVYLGTLLKTRRLDFLVRVLELVLKSVPDAKLYMVGPEELPGDMQLLEDEAARLGVQDQLILTGRLERAHALDLVRRCDVAFSPFYPTPILNSTSPTKLIEYMAIEKVVVANDHPEQRRVIDESRAGICVAWNEAAFAKAAIEMLQDPERASEMGRRGRQYVRKNRTYKVLADRLEAHYMTLLKGGGDVVEPM